MLTRVVLPSLAKFRPYAQITFPPSAVCLSSQTSTSQAENTDKEFGGQIPPALTGLDIANLPGKNSLQPAEEGRGLERNRKPDLHPGPIAGSEFRVSHKTDPLSFAGALTELLRRQNACEVLASGDEAVNQLIKGVATARLLIKRRNEGELWFHANHCFWLDRNSSNQMVFVVQRVEAPVDVCESVEILKVSRDTDIRVLASTIRLLLSRYGLVNVKAMGYTAVSRAAVALTWARRQCMTTGTDIETYPSFEQVEGADSFTYRLLCLTMVSKKVSEEFKDSKTLFALLPLRFPVSRDQLKSASEVFPDKMSVDLPVIKISAETLPGKSASAIIGYLRSSGGVQLFTNGSAANNQALKAITITRSYLKELPGFDLGFQSIHAPRQNKDGDCEIVSWVRLIADASKDLRSHDGEKVTFKIGNLNDAKSVGEAMAGQIVFCKRLHCSVIGVSAGARFLVALSHARIHLASEGIDLVVLPYFDQTVFIAGSEKKTFMCVKVDIIAIPRTKKRK